MKIKNVLLISFALILSGCASHRATFIHIRNSSDIEQHIGNTENTLYWTYCGKTEYGDLILKRKNGEYRSYDDPLYHKLPAKWLSEQWFLVRSDRLTLEKNITPGKKMTLRDGKFKVIDDSPKLKMGTSMFNYDPLEPITVIPPPEAPNQ